MGEKEEEFTLILQLIFILTIKFHDKECTLIKYALTNN